MVVVGAGHAALIALQALNARLDAEITLISAGHSAPYSGMVPGFIEGLYPLEAMMVPLPAFAARQGLRFVAAEVHEIDENVVRHDGGTIGYDILVINAGAIAARTGALESRAVVPGKPFPLLIEALQEALPRAAAFAVVGSGPAGLEVAFALRRRRPNAAITVLERAGEILPAFPSAFRRRVTRALGAAGIALRLDVRIERVEDTRVTLAGGETIRSAATLAFTGPAPPPLLERVPFERTADGFLAVDGAMRSRSHPNVLAVGDVATSVTDPRPKAGVFAVRAGLPLARAIEALVEGRAPPQVALQRRGLVLLATGGRRAIGVRNGIVVEGRLPWRLKDHLDRAFIARLNR